MYYTLYSSSDYYDNKLVQSEILSNQICLICWDCTNKEFPVHYMKNSSYIFTICDCNPQLHDTCLDSWVSKTESCPICRKKITKSINRVDYIRTNYFKSFTCFIVIVNFTYTICHLATIVSIFNLIFLCVYNFIIIHYIKHNSENNL